MQGHFAYFAAFYPVFTRPVLFQSIFARAGHTIGIEVIQMKRRQALLLLLLLTAAGLFAARQNHGLAVTASAAPRRCIALTFDDGPSPLTTPALLDGLKERGAHATFFLIGEQIAGNEDIVRRMKDEGHQVGNHSFTHVQLSAADDAALAEIQKTDEALRAVLGDGTYWLRPPWGFSSDALKAAVTVPMVYWSLDTMDWSVRSRDLVAYEIVNDARDGDIVLLHDLYPTSVDAALQAIDVLSAQGYEFVTLEELFACRSAAAEAGHLYLRPGEEVSW